MLTLTHEPMIGDTATVRIENELVRGHIVDTNPAGGDCLILLDITAPFFKGNTYSLGDTVLARRTTDPLGGNRYEALGKVHA